MATKKLMYDITFNRDDIDKAIEDITTMHADFWDDVTFDLATYGLMRLKEDFDDSETERQILMERK